MINVNKTKESIQNVLIFFTDAIAVFLAYYLSGFIWLTGYRHQSFWRVMQTLNNNIITIIIAVLITALFCNIKGDVLNRGKFEEFASVIKKSLIASAVIAVYELLSKTIHGVPRSVYVITFFLGIVLMYILRMLVKIYMRYRNGGIRTHSILVVTIKSRAEDTLAKVASRNDWMRRLDGVVITDEDMTGQTISGVPVVANVHSMMRYIKNEIVDEVFIDVDYKTRKSIKPMVMELEDMGVAVNLKLEILDSYKDFDCKLGFIGSVPVITFANRIYDWKGLFVKRCIDILGSLVGLVFMVIAMIFVAPAIMIESPGPIFFKQKRVGKNGRYFEIYKFRSMYMDAEERKAELMKDNKLGDGKMFKLDFDPRVIGNKVLPDGTHKTGIGDFIRRTSLDEFPQFFNVLKGDMSIIGTRPPLLSETSLYELHHRARLAIKPGITGMWQVSGRSDITDFEEVVRLDKEYIENWNIGLDIKILFKTVLVVFRKDGSM